MSDSNEIVPTQGGTTAEGDAVATLQAAMDAANAPATNEQPTEQEPQQEQPPVEQKQQEERFASKFAALSRKEKEIRARESKLNQQMAELEAKLKAIEAQQNEVSSYKQLPERLKKEPLKVLQESGLTFEQLADMVINDGKPTQDMVLKEYEQKVMSKVQELEKKLAEKEAKEQEEREAAALSAFQQQLVGFINETPDYELIRANNAEEIVYQVIEEHYNETGEILANKDACDAVEEYLLEEAKKLVDRDKVKKLLQPQQPPKPAAPTGKSSSTLSNAHAAQAPKSGVAKKLTDEESKAEAAKLLKWMD